MKKTSIKKSAFILLGIVFMVSVGLAFSPYQLQSSLVGSEGPYDRVIEDLTKIEPLPGQATVPAFQILDTIGINISCPLQVALLGEIQAVLESLQQSLNIYRSLQEALGALDAKSYQVLAEDIKRHEVRIEELLNQLEKACSEEDANVIPEQYDVRFMEGYIDHLIENTQTRDCYYRDAKLDQLKRIADNIKNNERELQLAEEKGEREAIERAKKDVQEAYDLLDEVLEEFQRECPEKDAEPAGENLESLEQ